MSKLKVAAVGDLHVSKSSKSYKDLFKQISKKADILLISGDLTAHGLSEQAVMLNEQLESVSIPVLGVLGNHEYEKGHENEIKDILRSGKMRFLEDTPFKLKNVGFAGVKGFIGGFGKYKLPPFGENILKDAVEEAKNQALILEKSLSELKTEKKVVVLHYSPIEQTIKGEPLQIFPFLGSSYLENAINRQNVLVVFHGHSHYGTYFGKTSKGIPVYNVSFPLLKKINPNQPFVLIKI